MVEPGRIRPGADVSELTAAIKALNERLDLLAAQTGESTVGSISDGDADVAFVVMPFDRDDLQDVYKHFVRPALAKRCGLACIRGDDIFGSNVVMDDVVTTIHSAKVIIADLTGQNANVFYEIGIAHAIGKPVLLLAQSIDDVPFDLRHRRILIYDFSPSGCKILEESIEAHVKNMLREIADA